MSRERIPSSCCCQKMSTAASRTLQEPILVKKQRPYSGQASGVVLMHNTAQPRGHHSPWAAWHLDSFPSLAQACVALQGTAQHCFPPGSAPQASCPPGCFMASTGSFVEVSLVPSACLRPPQSLCALTVPSVLLCGAGKPFPLGLHQPSHLVRAAPFPSGSWTRPQFTCWCRAEWEALSPTHLLIPLQPPGIISAASEAILGKPPLVPGSPGSL